MKHSDHLAIITVLVSSVMAAGCGGVIFGKTTIPYDQACGTAADNNCKVFSRDTPPLVLKQKRTIVPLDTGKERWASFLGGVYGLEETEGQIPARCADVALLNAEMLPDISNENPFSFDITSSDLVDANLGAALGTSLLKDASGATTTPTDEDSKKFSATLTASLKSTGNTTVTITGTYLEASLPATMQQDLLSFKPENIANEQVKTCRVWLDQHTMFRLISSISAFRIESFKLSDKSAFTAAFDAGVAAVSDATKQATLRAKWQSTINSTGTVHLANPVTGIYSFGFMIPAKHTGS
jgi:hypothetical protein